MATVNFPPFSPGGDLWGGSTIPISDGRPSWVCDTRPAAGAASAALMSGLNHCEWLSCAHTPPQHTPACTPAPTPAMHAHTGCQASRARARAQPAVERGLGDGGMGGDGGKTPLQSAAFASLPKGKSWAGRGLRPAPRSGPRRPGASTCLGGVGRRLATEVKVVVALDSLKRPLGPLPTARPLSEEAPCAGAGPAAAAAREGKPSEETRGRRRLPCGRRRSASLGRTQLTGAGSRGVARSPPPRRRGRSGATAHARCSPRDAVPPAPQPAAARAG